ncbi:MAG: hypothetical protein WCH62_06475 [Candidatus Omnitrophota bacterium]
MKIDSVHPITFDGSMVIIPAQEYALLRKEAGYTPTPKLDKRIKDARGRYKKQKTL